MTTTFPFRFGVLGEQVRSPESLAHTARQAERLGYSTFLLRDHFVREPFGDQLAPLVALAAVAGSTTTLRVGTVVLANDYRHPVMLAKEAATLDVLSGGRFEMGLGAGWLRDEYESAGMPFDLARLRVDRLEESLVILKGLLAGEKVTFDGEHYSIRSLSTFPAASQRPHPPIQVGAGSKRMLRLAGREADIVGVLPKALPEGAISDALSERTPEAMKQKIEWIREGAGPRMGDVELSMVISPVIDDDVRAAVARYTSGRDWARLPADQVLDMPAAFLGPVERIAEVMRARREQFGFSYYIVPDAIIERFAPVVECLAGT
ncbi:TIGR03621 family F420-dependent LLM class oxidoreductase [Phytoactinopolyspora mesophila]|uniref:TIGR03621 family F420-dependent LLM class oxidoreductase n=1 Tax=Phytoactinopolyspora mesophila TaxID=2650750 RepID=A0A7K3M9H1_9ACTN|nr:TIGR03621 family F420-dependent LLM class oxidoreductase [Phytoactinopolyspora mesophila]NDL59612.1 TIGR03621 family F420-dependent LLM class oxidoreductase [Phytoactinopolyspora mesophila]